jgi:hypothetical protein
MAWTFAALAFGWSQAVACWRMERQPWSTSEGSLER